MRAKMIDNTMQPVEQPYVQGEDLPQLDPAADLLDANLQAQKLAEYMLEYKGHLPFTVGIFGEWGEGKTTFVSLLYHHLKRVNEDKKLPTLFVNFSAWPYTTSDKLWRALILEIAQVLYGKKQPGIHHIAAQPETNTTTNIVEAPQRQETTQPSGLMVMLANFFSGDALELWRPPPPPDPYKDLVAKLDDANYGAVNQRNAQNQLNPDAAMALMFRSAVAVLSLVSPLASGLRNLFNLEPKIEVAELMNKQTNETTRETIEALPRFQNIFHDMVEERSQGQPVYVFIDDLDRCQPDIALDILEAIRIALLDVRCVFIIAVDERLIAQGLRLRYKELFASEPSPGAFTTKGQEYLEKIIQFRLRVPPRTAQQTNRFIAAQFPLWATAGDIIQTVAGTNPRRLKQYCQRLDFQRIVGQSPFALGLPRHGIDSAREVDGVDSSRQVVGASGKSSTVEQTTSAELEHIRKLLSTYQRRLRALQVQQAQFGMQAPPNIIIEIEDISREIAELQKQEDQLQVQEIEQQRRNLLQRLRIREEQLAHQGPLPSVATLKEVNQLKMDIAQLEQDRARLYQGDDSQGDEESRKDDALSEDVALPAPAESVVSSDLQSNGPEQSER